MIGSSVSRRGILRQRIDSASFRRAMRAWIGLVPRKRSLEPMAENDSYRV
ncbi:MAG: hypothetical protein VB858_13520 [Planctomycetaceae bacterium]